MSDPNHPTSEFPLPFFRSRPREMSQEKLMFHPLVRVARCTWLQLRILDQTDVCSNSCHIFLPIHWSVWYRSEILTWQLRNAETPKAGRSAKFGWQVPKSRDPHRPRFDSQLEAKSPNQVFCLVIFKHFGDLA